MREMPLSCVFHANNSLVVSGVLPGAVGKSSDSEDLPCEASLEVSLDVEYVFAYLNGATQNTWCK